MPDRDPTQSWWRWPWAHWAAGVLLGVVLILSWAVYHGRVQRDAVEMIRRGGGRAFHAWELRHGRYDPKHWLWQISIVDPEGQPPWPPWMVALLGVDALTEVKMAHIGPNDPDGVMAYVGGLHSLEEVTFDEKSFLTDAGMVHLRGLTELKILHLPKGSITGKSLANLRGLTRLQDLFIAGISLEAADLSPLRQLTELENLIVGNSMSSPCDLSALRDLKQLKLISLTKIVISDLEPIRQLPHLLSLNLVDSELDDAGLAPLGEPGSLPELSGLFLVNTRISDAGLKTLRKLQRVAGLHLEGTPITDAGMDDLGAMTQMQSLSLARTGITDAGLAVLVSKLSELNGLNLASTQITDVGLKHLSRLRHPVVLNLTQTRVTDVGVAAFLKVHPFVRIIR